MYFKLKIKLKTNYITSLHNFLTSYLRTRIEILKPWDWEWEWDWDGIGIQVGWDWLGLGLKNWQFLSSSLHSSLHI